MKRSAAPAALLSLSVQTPDATRHDHHSAITSLLALRTGQRNQLARSALRQLPRRMNSDSIPGIFQQRGEPTRQPLKCGELYRLLWLRAYLAVRASKEGNALLRMWRDSDDCKYRDALLALLSVRAENEKYSIRSWCLILGVRLEHVLTVWPLNRIVLVCCKRRVPEIYLHQAKRLSNLL